MTRWMLRFCLGVFAALLILAMAWVWPGKTLAQPLDSPGGVSLLALPKKESAFSETGGRAAETFVFQAADPITITVGELQDVYIFKNFDPNPIFEQVAQGNHNLSVEVRFAPTGRDDPWRPAPGVIHEARSVLELDLQPLIDQYPHGIGDIKLHLENWTCTSASQGGITLLATAYLGDGVVNLADNSVTSLASLGQVRIPGPNSLLDPLDLTDLVNYMVTSGQRWLGVHFMVDYSTLPPRHTLATDTSFGCGMYAAESNHDPYLVAVPGPERITDLKVAVSSGESDIRVFFTAPDSPGDQAAAYDLRYATELLTDANWETAPGLVIVPISGPPKMPGGNERLWLPSKPGLLRYFAIRAQDPYGIWSPVSNNAMIVETGFRPFEDGYSFENNTTTLPILPTDFTLADLTAIVGDETTCQAHIPACVPFVSADFQVELMQKSLKIGRCAGFSATAERMFRGVETPGQFQPGASTVSALTVTPAVSHYLSFYQLLQYFDPIRITSVPPWNATPNSVLADLKELLQHAGTTPVQIGLCQQVGFYRCHAVLPVSVAEWYLEGGTVSRVQVMDPNMPGDLAIINFFTASNQVEYWVGNFNSMIQHEDLLLYNAHAMPPLAREGGETLVADRIITWVSGWANQSVTDDQGRRLAGDGAAFGWEPGFINEIPEAELIPLFGGVEPAAPMFRLPLTSTQYTLLLHGEIFTSTGEVTTTRALTPSAPAAFFLVGEDAGLSLDNLAIQPGQTDSLVVSPDGTVFSYHAQVDRLGVDLSIGFDLPGESWLFTFNDVNLYAGKTFTLTVNLEAGSLVLDNHDHWGFWTTLEMEKRTPQGRQFFRSGAFPVDFEDIQRLDFGSWDGVTGLEVQVDHGGNGTIDEVRTLANELPHIYLPLVVR